MVSDHDPAAKRDYISNMETIAEQVAASVVPPRGVYGDPKPQNPLPVSHLPALPRDGSMLYRIAAADDRGRIADSAVIGALAWPPCESLSVDVVSEILVCRPHLIGASKVTRRGHIHLAQPVREWAALAPGDRVLLAAAPSQKFLLIYTMSALDAMLVRYHASLTTPEQS